MLTLGGGGGGGPDGLFSKIYVYVVVNFLSQVIFLFLLFKLH